MSVLTSSFRVPRKSFPAPEGQPRSDMPLGLTGFRYADLFLPDRLRELYNVFCSELEQKAPDTWRLYEAYRSHHAEGKTTADETSSALLAVAPHVSDFVGRL